MLVLWSGREFPELMAEDVRLASEQLAYVARCYSADVVVRQQIERVLAFLDAVEKQIRES